MNENANREAWLMRAVDLLKPHFYLAADVQVPDVRVSVGWPGGGSGRKSVAHTIGQCWSSLAASDSMAQIFISPTLAADDPIKILGTLVHEMVHAVDDNASGHRGNFIKIARAVGLERPWTATTPSDTLADWLREVADILGPYPHGALSPGLLGRTTPRQTTRMLKVQCIYSDYVVRMTRKWIDDIGTPICPCHNEPMEEM